MPEFQKQIEACLKAMLNIINDTTTITTANATAADRLSAVSRLRQGLPANAKASLGETHVAAFTEWFAGAFTAKAEAIVATSIEVVDPELKSFMAALDPIKDFVSFDAEPTNKDNYIKKLDAIISTDIKGDCNILLEVARGVQDDQLHWQLSLLTSIFRLSLATAKVSRVFATANSRDELKPSEQSTSFGLLRDLRSAQKLHTQVFNQFEEKHRLEDAFASTAHMVQDLDGFIDGEQIVASCKRQAAQCLEMSETLGARTSGS